MKEKIIRKIYLLGIVVFLTACGTKTSQVPIATLTSIPQSTSTPLPTRTPRPTNTPRPTSTPLPPIPSFNGKLILTHSGGIIALGRDPTTGDIQRVQVSTNRAEEVIFSPDGRHAIFYSPGNSELIDLSGFETITSFPERSSCFEWAPNSHRVSFKHSHSLETFDVTTQAFKLIFESPSANYTFGKHYGDLNCGYWIEEDLLIFQRFSGFMPFTITAPFFPELNVNKSTIAVISDESIELVDYPRLLDIEDVSKDGKYVLWMKEKDFVVSNLADENANSGPRPLPVSGDAYFHDSGRIIVENRETVNIIDPETLEVLMEFMKPTTLSESYIWIGDPIDGIVVWRDRARVEIMIGDLNTGRVERYLDSIPYYDFEILAWLP